MTPSRRSDLLTWPLFGRFLTWRHARAAMQAPVLLLAGLVVFDGLVGPQLAPKNLATVSVWLHYRGLVVLALLVAGNLFCMACPFMLPRRAARWLRERLGGGWFVPPFLRNKWLAIALVVLFFYCYEVFDLWASPWLTAWIVLGYFVVGFAVDAVFRGAAFCKYVCPLGQFNFFGSLLSPLEIKVRRPDTCAACRTKDCITAGPGAAGRGCELWLFQPRKTGNMDCTFCLDCVHACPFDNIGLIGRVPTAELWNDPFRSGIGRFSRRRDLTALVVVFTFGAFLNAFGMIRPVYALQQGLAAWLGTGSQAPGWLMILVLGLGLLPLGLLALAGWAARSLVGSGCGSAGDLIGHYVYALVPMGFGMWLAHYSFHFLTGGLTIVPVVQSFLADIGLYAGTVQWGLGALVPAGWLFPLEAALLYAGALGSLVVAFQITQNIVLPSRTGGNTEGMSHSARAGNERKAVLGAVLPWALLILSLLGFGLWILVQPMEMRGTMMMLTTPGG